MSSDVTDVIYRQGKEINELRNHAREIDETLRGRDGGGGMVAEFRGLSAKLERVLGKQDTLMQSIQDIRALVTGAIYLMVGGALMSMLISFVAIGISITAYLKP